MRRRDGLRIRAPCTRRPARHLTRRSLVALNWAQCLPQHARPASSPNLPCPALPGFKQAEISRIERGLGNPTAATLSRLAAALGQKITLTRVP
ncbi:XRE family transcriptional regulator [Cryobacterium sp. TMT2-18-3]|uniref:helix-turn-helix domain-containing protein n=1 Tax=unclassified Cryobacterium TaxID=2649013 RepID=UPI00106BC259|nr:XRE family transcriptional regulator [Cryobacterium sp. TMT2-18-2]TFC34632.1 XRE family transcriptional regulator [Cryobacterium sp. TMT2-42-4]TFC67500.1 XRE family transcriptional regulator [Cryobacterium sp. TMT2-18-3]